MSRADPLFPSFPHGTIASSEPAAIETSDITRSFPGLPRAGVRIYNGRVAGGDPAGTPKVSKAGTFRREKR